MNIWIAIKCKFFVKWRSMSFSIPISACDLFCQKEAAKKTPSWIAQSLNERWIFYDNVERKSCSGQDKNFWLISRDEPESWVLLEEGFVMHLRLERYCITSCFHPTRPLTLEVLLQLDELNAAIARKCLELANRRGIVFYYTIIPSRVSRCSSQVPAGIFFEYYSYTSSSLLSRDCLFWLCEYLFLTFLYDKRLDSSNNIKMHHDQYVC